jgi:hypothetical protein
MNYSTDLDQQKCQGRSWFVIMKHGASRNTFAYVIDCFLCLLFIGYGFWFALFKVWIVLGVDQLVLYMVF